MCSQNALDEEPCGSCQPLAPSLESLRLYSSKIRDMWTLAASQEEHEEGIKRMLDNKKRQFSRGNSDLRPLATKINSTHTLQKTFAGKSISHWVAQDFN